jgi:hypothetical protein
MLEDETWMNGSECVAQGFADQTTPSLQAMACIQSKRIEEFEKMPNAIRNMITPPRNATRVNPRTRQTRSSNQQLPFWTKMPLSRGLWLNRKPV